MKKSITILAIMVIALVAMMGVVNAADFSINPSSVEKIAVGDTFTVTVTTKEKSDAIQFHMKYPTGFKYVSATADGKLIPVVNVVEKTNVVGVLAVGFRGEKGNSVTLKFEATEAVELKEGSDIAKDFVALNNLKLAGNQDDPFTTSKKSITVKAVQPSTPPDETDSDQNETDSDQNETGTGTGLGETGTGDKVGTDGNVIKRLPQTGTPLYIGAAALVLAVAAGVSVLVAKKVRK